MQEKMRRFLTSIKVSDIERFDLDFDMAGWNPYVPKQFDMIIRKTQPWEYSLLQEFIDCLSNITYKYTIRFYYENEPTAEDAVSLFPDWYLSLFHAVASYQVVAKKNNVIFLYPNEEAAKAGKSIAKEFASLLEWLNYGLNIEEEIVASETPAVKEEPKPVEAPKVEEPKPAEQAKPAEQIKEEPARKRTKEEITQAEIVATTEDNLLGVMEANQKRMEEERERERLFHKGDYKIADSIAQIYEMGKCNVDFIGNIFSAETRLTKTGRTIFSGQIGDMSGGVGFLAFSNDRTLKPEFLASITPDPKKGNEFHVRMRGAIGVNKYSGALEITVHFIDQLPVPPLRDDPEEEKRVELHLHTKMSTMDATAEAEDYIKLAANMGMKAMAITDHGVLQAFPPAQPVAEKKGVKLLYGCEFYMIDTIQQIIMNACGTELLKGTYCVFDTETTGLSAKYDRLTEFGAVLVKNGAIVSSEDFFVNPGMSIPEKVSLKTHITDDMVKDGLSELEAIKRIEKFAGDAILVSHNATFDIGFLNAARKRNGMAPISNPVIDTLGLSRYLFPESKGHSLGRLTKNLGLDTYEDESAHRADYDAKALYYVWEAIQHRLTEHNQNLTHAQLQDMRCDNPNFYRHLRPKHVIALAKNEKGLSALYKLVSASHLQYLANVPKIPREEIQANREDLLLGSACFNGEIFDLAMTRDKNDLIEAMKFYDYIEVQPVENYSYLISTGDVASKDQLISYLKDIVEAADEAGKLCCATGDVHYLNPEDKITRDVYVYAKAIGNGRHPMNPIFRDRLPIFENPDQHFRSTREMLDSFVPWLGEEKSREIIIKNTNAIADMIEVVHPVKEGIFAPNANLPNSAGLIKDLCWNNFYKRYGEKPHPGDEEAYESIKARLEKELAGIIGNGYAVTYYIAHRIVKKSNDDGYIVGSRGSVGSSFAANMAEITEVNALKPHYWCPNCKHFEWAVDKTVRSGFDLPRKNCPLCGTKMVADGQDIPFETFLGFKAEKVPDIDLNFPSDYQAKAHAYTRELLGADNVFRAGTIETVAEKTAFGHVRGYYERIGKNPDDIPPATIAYFAKRCVGVKRTTGQHPGGIVVIPADHNKFEFTAIQHPADDPNADWLTTHYDFSSMHDELLKLDLLGHVDPRAMRLMSLYTGVAIKDIPMDDTKVFSLFNNPSALGLKRNYTDIKTGSVGLPEFGTNLAQRMLVTAKPKCFNDLLIISGLAHGTNVWSGNAEDLINSGTATLQQVIGCRDDIMRYLIELGLDNSESFKIMEDVRKGRKLKPEYEADMREHGVPDYYIDSCKKIAYLFPRGHATAYVMMAVRVGYFKLYYPLDFYAVFFSVRCDDWDIETMVKGEEAVIAKLEEYKRREANRDPTLKPKDKNINATMSVALEMLERGYKFEMIDLYKSEASLFVVDHENQAIIAPFAVLDGLGESAAESVVEARKDKKFLSKEDLLKRTKLNGSNVADLERLGVLDGLGDTNQMSLFEFM